MSVAETTPNPASLPLRWLGPGYALLLALAVVAFWPGYFGRPATEASAWTHFHAIVSMLWIVILIVQPVLAHAGRLRWHRRIGRATLVLAPLVIASFVGLAHEAIRGASGMAFATEAYFLYLRLVLAAMFVLAYAMGIRNRRDPSLHARYMACTGLALVDPVFSRLLFRLLGRNPDFNYQLFALIVAAAILVALIVAERKATRGRHVFPAMLACIAVLEAPLLLDFHTWGAPWDRWKSVAAAFASLPLP